MHIYRCNLNILDLLYLISRSDEMFKEANICLFLKSEESERALIKHLPITHSYELFQLSLYVMQV